MSEHHDIVIIGAGQGGLSTSYYLRRAGLDHVVLDRGGIAHAWRHERWDSFCLVTPNWTIRLPGAEYAGDDPDGFMPRDDFVAYMEDWARGFGAPVRDGIEVTRLRGTAGRFRLESSDGSMTARVVVVATATYQAPRIPPLARHLPATVTQIAADAYRNPRALPDGAVLVVGSGQTGAQIAEESLEAGRRVYLCTGRAGRLPRRYRGRDCLEWQRDMGLLDRTPDMLDDPARRFVGDPHLSGRGGGHTLSLHDFHAKGMVLLGKLIGAEDGALRLAGDLRENLAFADAFADDFMGKVDAHIEHKGLRAPPATPDELAGEPPSGDWSLPVIERLDLAEAGITSLVWATGFNYDFSWIEFPVLDSFGYPRTERGVSRVPGLTFMGLNWMHKRKSGILYGVGEDARAVSDHIIDVCRRGPAPAACVQGGA